MEDGLGNALRGRPVGPPTRNWMSVLVAKQEIRGHTRVMVGTCIAEMWMRSRVVGDASRAGNIT